MRKLSILLLCLIACFPSCLTYACTSVIISGKLTKDGRPLMWKNRDTGTLENCVIYQKGERYAYLAIINSNSITRPRSVWMGVNEKGFAIMNTLSYNLSDSANDLGGKYNGAIMKRALEVCADIADFKNLLDTLPRPLYATANYGVIDAAGGASYFETNQTSYKQFDVNDPLVCPKGYLARANFSESGIDKAGKGYPRYQQVQIEMDRAIDQELSVTPQWIFNTLSRSFVNPVMGIDLTSGNYNKPVTNGWFTEEDFIARRKSSCAAVVQGVKKNENVSQTIMWTVLGYPPVTPAIPLWVAAGNAGLPKVVTYSPEIKDAPLCHYADSLRQQVYSYEYGDNKQDYFNWELLYNKENTGLMQKTRKFETTLFSVYDGVVEKLRTKRDLDKTAVLKLYHKIDGEILDWMKQ